MITFTPKKLENIIIMKRILGIDTGTNSLGWAVVDKNEMGEYSLVRKGSLIFQEGVKIEQVLLDWKKKGQNASCYQRMSPIISGRLTRLLHCHCIWLFC